MANHRRVCRVVGKIRERGELLAQIKLGRKEGISPPHPRRRHAEFIEIEIKLGIGGKRRRDGRQRGRAVNGAKPVARRSGAEPEDRVATAGRARIERPSECVKRGRNLRSQVGGRAKVAVAQKNRLAIERLDGAEETTAALGKLGAKRKRDLRALATAGLGKALPHDDLGAVKLTLEHVIDDAAHRIGTVNRRGAVAEHFNALDALSRELVYVYGLGQTRGHRVDRHAAAVNEDERAGRAKITEIDVGVITTGARRPQPRFVFREIHDRGKRREHIDGQEGVPHRHRVLIKNCDGHDFLHVRALNVGARHNETLELDHLALFSGRDRMGRQKQQTREKESPSALGRTRPA